MIEAFALFTNANGVKCWTDAKLIPTTADPKKYFTPFVLSNLIRIELLPITPNPYVASWGNPYSYNPALGRYI